MSSKKITFTTVAQVRSACRLLVPKNESPHTVRINLKGDGTCSSSQLTLTCVHTQMGRLTARQSQGAFSGSYKAIDFTFKDVKGVNFTKIGRAALALGAKKVRITYHDKTSNTRTTTVLHTTNGTLHYKHNRPLDGLADLSLNEVYTIVFDLQPERSA